MTFKEIIITGIIVGISWMIGASLFIGFFQYKLRKLRKDLERIKKKLKEVENEN